MDAEGYEMKISNLNWRLAGAVAMLMASFSVNADTRVEQVWTCTLNDGNTLEELNAIIERTRPDLLHTCISID